VVEEEEARELVKFSPGVAKYAHYPDDLVLVWRFAHILGSMCPAALQTVRQEHLYTTILKGVRLMHLCDYNYSDVVMTLAHTSIYFTSIFESVGHKMGENEAAMVCVLLMFLAHSFVLDESCPLRYWQKHIFRKYCTLKVLDAALFRLFRMRDYLLRITEEEERHVLRILLRPAHELDIIVTGPEAPHFGGVKGCSDDEQHQYFRKDTDNHSIQLVRGARSNHHVANGHGHRNTATNGASAQRAPGRPTKPVSPEEKLRGGRSCC
jgi:hypothetical protein